MEAVKIYTDGGCSGNPGPGAWAFIILDGVAKIQGSGSHPSTTNNRMELAATIAALRELAKHPEWKGRSLEIYTDSRYLQQGITRWINSWRRNGWRTSQNKPVKNQGLWQRLLKLSSPFSIHWNWVPGHAGHTLNEECDRLVQEAIKSINF